MKRKLRAVLMVIVVLAVIYLMPFITVLKNDTQGRQWRVPFGTSYLKEENNQLFFSSFRSAYALNKDADNAFHALNEVKCYGKTYYYDEQNDVSFYSHEADGVLPVTLRYSFEEGDACYGWSVDDEIAWPLGKIEEADWDISEEEAVENGWVVVRDGKAVNIGEYNDFSRLMKQGVYSAKRILLYEGKILKEMIDIQLLENARYKVTIRDTDTIKIEQYARFSDQETDEGVKEVCVYNGAFKEEVPVLLFTIE